MCGITGYIDFSGKEHGQSLERMVRVLGHRGPDDTGLEFFRIANTHVGMGQRRLSIIDTSSAGHQPMQYKHLCIVFNGEIYNYREIRADLQKCGRQFQTNTDTEVILQSFAEWGIDAIHRFVGMFAFMLIDTTSETVYIVRDRVGVKPLYYFIDNGLFLFASELKAFHKHTNFDRDIDPVALSMYFDYGYIPGPYAIFKNCKKLQSGHFLKIELRTRRIENIGYWNVNCFYRQKIEIPYNEAKSRLKILLNSACSYRMVSDVPVGVFLSGGYDSTAVAAIIQSNSTSRLKTFTIGFESGNNETEYARASAQFLGTDHTDYICSPKEAKDIIPVLPYYFDEPFADSSSIPTILVSRLARKDVTVALSADGGDEIFAGYNSYRTMLKRVKMLRSIPQPFRSPVGLFLKGIFWATPSSFTSFKHKVHGFSDALDRSSEREQLLWMYHNSRLLSRQLRSSMIRPQICHVLNKTHADSDFSHPIEAAMVLDYNTYLTDDILTKVDRASMSVSLEGREPLLDHRIVEFAASLPLEFKFDGKVSKRIFKDIVHDYVPKSMMDRPKTGFSLPIYNWLRSDLAYMLDEYINEKELNETSVFQTKEVLKAVRLFKEGRFHYKPFIWKTLMFQMWYKRWMNNSL